MVVQYRKKPVVIEAMCCVGNAEQVRDWVNIYAPGVAWITSEAAGSSFFITTLEGDMRVNDGDYVIRGVAGEFYPCKPDIFDKTYERVRDSDLVSVSHEGMRYAQPTASSLDHPLSCRCAECEPDYS